VSSITNRGEWRVFEKRGITGIVLRDFTDRVWEKAHFEEWNL